MARSIHKVVPSASTISEQEFPAAWNQLNGQVEERKTELRAMSADADCKVTLSMFVRMS